MRSQSSTIESVSFSTRGLPPRGRHDALRSLQERGIMTVEPLRDHVPHAAIRKRFLPGADILSGTIGGLRQFGTQHGGDNVFFSGSRRRQHRLRAGPGNHPAQRRRVGLFRR